MELQKKHLVKLKVVACAKQNGCAWGVVGSCQDVALILLGGFRKVAKTFRINAAVTIEFVHAKFVRTVLRKWVETGHTRTIT